MASKIEWTGSTWNPIVGCSVVSPGCTHCYAMRMAARLEAMGRTHYAGLTAASKAGPVWTGKLALAPDTILFAPLRRRKPTTWFVNSMGDLFHESVPDEWIDRVFAVMALSPQHTFQVLTKRSMRMRAYIARLESQRAGFSGFEPWKNACARLFLAAQNLNWFVDAPGDGSYLPNRWPGWPLPDVWLGISAEDQTRADERVPDLLATPAAVRFVSAEPLLGPIDFRKIKPKDRYELDALTGYDFDQGLPRERLDWIIVGGESGPGGRPMHPQWTVSIRDQCADASVPFFFKQWGEWVTRQHACAIGKADTENRVVEGSSFPTIMSRVGKKAAGRLLDGVTHDAMPGREAA